MSLVSFLDIGLTPQPTQCSLDITYKHLHQDVRQAVDWCHQQGLLKKVTLASIDKYVARNPPRLGGLLARMKEKSVSFVVSLSSSTKSCFVSGAKLFLLTNSEYYYTKEIMSFLLNDAHPAYPSWRDYFDVAICSAAKVRAAATPLATRVDTWRVAAVVL